MRRSRHRRQHGRESRISPENFQHHEAFVGAGEVAQRIRHLNRPRDARAEPDAVIRPRHDRCPIVFGIATTRTPFLVQTARVTERVVAADRNHVFDAQPPRDSSALPAVRSLFSALYSALQVNPARCSLLTRAGFVREECRKSAAGAARPIHYNPPSAAENYSNCRAFRRGHVPPAPPSHGGCRHFVTFSKCAKSDRADGRIQSLHVTAARQDSITPFFTFIFAMMLCSPHCGLAKQMIMGRCHEY